MKLKVRSILLFTLFLFLFTFLLSYLAIPKEIYVIEGRDYNLSIKTPFKVNVTDNPAITTCKSFNLDNPLKLNASEKGEYDLSFDLMGVFPVKSNVKVLKETYVYPSGESCGVKILTDGVLVISVTGIKDFMGNTISPAGISGILPGDFIKSINGKEIKNTKSFINTVRSNGSKPMKIEYLRDGVLKKTAITPIKSPSGEYVLGIWARDSTAGLGTLTFYTGDKSGFAALGHSITDVDTDEIMSVKDGDLVKSKIISATKGEKGKAGELTGVFEEPTVKIGTIKLNCDFGIYGNVKNKNLLKGMTPVPIGLKSDIKPGKAKIITTVDKNIPEEFEVEIIKINKQNSPDVKGLVIKVTDKKLIKKTGGIVQGMSGSPIVQNGKLVGAVTHVFVNDPTRGYGIFIENMLFEAEKIK